MSAGAPQGRETPALALAGVVKSFPGPGGASAPVLGPIDLTVAPGRFVSVLGPSGCGKSTLLRLIDGLTSPDTGSIRVWGAPPAPGPDIGLVFQSYRLIPWETVLGNVEFALRALTLTPAERRKRASSYLALVGLERVAPAYPAQLSGGMRQRVALARALSCAPRLLLMDEPFASVDAQTRELMQIELLGIVDKLAPTVLFVTHSVDEAILLSDRIIVLGGRPAQVVDSVEVTLARPRWRPDLRADPVYLELRHQLSTQLRDLVLADPNSAFFGRKTLASTASASDGD